MDQRSDYIRQDIESTRASLDEKLDTLETKARQTFDLKYQVSERPWMMLGAAVAAGYMLGSLGGGEEPQRWHGQPATTTDYNQHASGTGYNQPSQHTSGTGYNQYTSSSTSYRSNRGDSFLSQFDEEIEMLKMAAVSTLTNFLRDSIREYIPALGQQIDRTSHQHSSRTPSTAPNASMSAGSRPAGFDSPPETTYASSNMAASATEHAAPYYPPGSTGASGDRDYVKTYHPPSEAERERTVGDEGRRY